MTDERYIPIDFKNTNLFKPLKLSDKITLKHRAILGPLTRFRADEDHALKQTTDYTETDDWKKFISDPANKTGIKKKGLVEEYYYQRTQRPGTLAITEGTFPYAQAGGFDYAPGIYTEKQIKSLSKVADAVHENGSFIFAQFWNLGRTADPEVLQKNGLKYVSSSDNYISSGDIMETKRKALETGNLLKPLSIEQIEQIKKDYLEATRNCFKAGVDGVEIHAAGGYLLNQFFDKETNTRNDQYGGQSFENRARLYLEIFDLVVSEFGPDKVGTKISPFIDINGVSGYKDISDTIGFYSYLVDQLEQRRLKGKGPVYLSLQEPRFNDDFTSEVSTDYGKISNQFVFELYKGVIIIAGNLILESDYAKQTVDQDDRTLLAYGRFFISNPDLIDRLENQWPLNKYDRSTFYAYTYKGYVDYPYYKNK
ncbi:hypothetical protein ACO0SA_004626 [Hanseniaspora valbyensis]